MSTVTSCLILAAGGYLLCMLVVFIGIRTSNDYNEHGYEDHNGTKVQDDD